MMIGRIKSARRSDTGTHACNFCRASTTALTLTEPVGIEFETFRAHASIQHERKTKLAVRVNVAPAAVAGIVLNTNAKVQGEPLLTNALGPLNAAFFFICVAVASVCAAATIVARVTIAQRCGRACAGGIAQSRWGS